MHPSMSIGRNYRLGLDKKLREINKLNETTMSIKILDEDRHLLHFPRQNSKSKIKKTHTTNTTTADYICPGVVTLAVNQINVPITTYRPNGVGSSLPLGLRYLKIFHSTYIIRYIIMQ